jgi:tetratricopeptide (TPR) repeat protein
MLRALNALSIIIFSIRLLFAQEIDPRLYPVQQKYADFEYDQVIALSEELLSGAAGLSQSDSLELYRLQAIAYYSLLDMSGALKAFSTLLDLNPEYRLSVINTPPKVITFFNDLKALQPEPQTKTVTIVHHDTLYQQAIFPGRQIAFSMLLPGLGHIQTEESTKGWILLAAGTASLAATIYYGIDAADKEEKYLKESNRDQIETLYNSYNDAYRLRNTFLSLFGAIWIYTQIDLLLINPIQIDDQLTIDFQPLKKSSLSLSYSF